MNKQVLNLGLVVVLLALVSFVPPAGKIKVYLIGDSTMAAKQTKAYPENGWGMPFVNFFNEQVSVENHAQNGRSTRTFVEENRWKLVLDSLKKGDYVFIQFGHNDEVSTKRSYTTPEAFEGFLRQFISDTRHKKAFPVLLTPVARRKFDAAGKIEDTHAAYAAIVRAVAEKEQVPFIDLNQKSMELYQKYGPETSKLLFNHLEPGIHPNYPQGKIDDTHFNELGAREVAQIVLQGVRNLQLDLAAYVVKPPVKKI